MKASTVVISTLCLFLAACTIPCDIYFRNFSNETVRLEATLTNRSFFNKLPNTVNFYDTAQKKNETCGKWRYQKLVTWFDSTHFFVDVPPNTIINVADISNGLTLGTKALDIILVAFTANKADTITAGDYASVAAKFQQKRSVFGKPVYYYTLQ